MGSALLATDFAPAERAAGELLEHQVQCVLAHPQLGVLLDCLPDPVLILNQQRQIVRCNGRLAELLGTTPDALVGKRPGEALTCVHASDGPNGCGTSRFRRVCGAVSAILRSQNRNLPAIEECRITRHSSDGTASLDLLVWATPTTFGAETFTVFVVRDIGDQKRRLLLERLFFHDVLNAAGGLQGVLELLPTLSASEAAEFVQLAEGLARQVVDEIQAQRELLAAERGELQVDRQVVDVAELLTQLCQFYGNHAVAAGRTICPPRLQGNPRIVTDPTLLRRVVGNLIKNALEASLPGQAVSVLYENESNPRIQVHNQGVMSDEVQLQIFQRFFSTKGGNGRGVGSYSVKLLTEKYLGGTVDFLSRDGLGTIFTLNLEPAPSGTNLGRRSTD